MASIDFMMLPEPGHLNPSLKLARLLKRRGHTVFYLGPLSIEPYVRSQNLDYLRVVDSFYGRGGSAHPGEHLPEGAADDDGADLQSILLDKALQMIENEREPEAIDPTTALKQAIPDWFVPDLMVIDYHLWGFANLLYRLGIQSVLLNPSLELPAHLNSVFAHPRFIRDTPLLFLCPQDFDYPRTDLGSFRFHYIEPSVDLFRKEMEFSWDPIDSSRPLIYCSMGTQTHRYRQMRELLKRIIEAVSLRRDWQLVLCTGNLSIEEFGSPPSNITLVRSAPQLKMLRRASAMITHGGLGSVKECILMGVPMLVFPFDTDQPANALRVVHHGIGVSERPNSASVEKVLKLLEAVVGDASIRRRVGQMALKFRQEEAFGRGVRLIDTILQARKACTVKAN